MRLIGGLIEKLQRHPKRIVFPEGIATSSPVLGFRPTPRFRGLTTNTPKPRSSILSPRVRASFIEWKRASTACSAFILGTPVLSATRLTISSLITAFSLRSSLNGRIVFEPNLQGAMIERRSKACQPVTGQDGLKWQFRVSALEPLAKLGVLGFRPGGARCL